MKLDKDFRLFDKGAREAFNAQPMEKKEKSLQAKTFILYPFEVKYNQEKTFEEKEAETLFMIEEHLKNHKRSYVATSYGMDSVVLMHLVIRASKNVGCEIPDMFLNDTLNTYKEEKKYWAEINKLFGIEDKFRMFKPPKDENGKQQTVWTIAKKYGLPTFRAMSGRGDAYKRRLKYSSPQKQKKDMGANKGNTPQCCDILKKKTMKKFLKSIDASERYDCHFVGTRAEESHMRKMSVLQRCRSYVIKTLFPYPIRAVTPLSFWLKKDIYEYYARYDIPKNPAYEAHNQDRLGCASCPAHKNWELRLAKDPTSEGLGMLRLNLKILKETEPDRFKASLELMKKHKVVPELIAEFENNKESLITSYTNEDEKHE